MPDFSAYALAGWALCALPHGEKSPTYGKWNTTPLPVDACVELPGAGLLHALSGTCALDIDDLEAARPWLAERGVDIDALLEADDALGISSGRPNRVKLLYRMRNPMVSCAPKGSGVELRCATVSGTSLHDVLPGSVNPVSKQVYEWTGGPLGDWRAPPPVPASLLALWRSLSADEPSAQVLDRVDASTPRVDLIRLRKAAFQHSPDAEYDEWLKIGMQLHEGTGGAAEGLEIWQDWSRGIKRAPYPGDEFLKAKYMTFKRAAGAATGEALVAEVPAEAEDFEVIPAEPEQTPDEYATELERKRQLKEDVKAAKAALEDILIYVYAAESYFDLERHSVVGSDNAIRHQYTSRMPRGRKGTRLDPVKVLRESTTKRYVDCIGFHPGEGAIFHDPVTGLSFANMYRSQLPEPIEPMTDELERIEFLFERIDDSAFREWLRQFFGHVVQHPGVKINSAPLIWSEEQGNGKTTLLKVIPSRLVGLQYSREVSCSLLESGFNDYLVNAWHVNLAEFRAGTRGERESISEKLKSWIADAVVAIHPKGSPGYTMPNHFFVTATSNKDDAAAIDNKDRRWAVHELHAPQFTPTEQTWMYQFLNSPRAPAVLRHYFLNVSLDGFVASRAAPVTQAKMDMVDASVTMDFDVLRTAFEQRVEPFQKDVVITADVAAWASRHLRYQVTPQRVGKMLCKAPFNGKPYQFRYGKGVYRAVVLRGPWHGMPGGAIMAHINSEDIDLTE